MPLAETLDISESWAEPKASNNTLRRRKASGKPSRSGSEDFSGDDYAFATNSLGRGQRLVGSAFLQEDMDGDELATSGMLRWRNHKKFKVSTLPSPPTPPTPPKKTPRAESFQLRV